MIRSHILVLPFERHLISSICNQALVVRIDDPRDVASAAEMTRRHNILHAVRLESALPLSFIPFEAAWCKIPLAVYAPELGDFRGVADMLHLLRSLNMRLFLPAENMENFTSIRILSSLKIPAGLSFNGGAPDWEMMSDLMHYAIYSRVEHAPVEPFHYLVSNYEINGRTDFGPVYFENPRRYVHINREGKAALSASDLEAGIYICETLEDLNGLDEIPGCKERETAWQEHFLSAEGCAYCKGWRVCIGRFSGVTQDREACGNFFEEMMEAAEHYQKAGRKGARLWQP